MRKDVQIGFVIGVVLLAVLVVYVLVVPGTNKRGTELATGNASGGNTAVDRPAVTPATQPAVTVTPVPTTMPASVAVNDTMPLQPTQTAAGDPDWNRLLGGQQTLSPLVSRTPVADHRGARIPTSVDPFASTPTTQPSSTALTASPGSTAVARTHTIQKGETLGSIARAAYGDANLYPKIMAANPGLNPKNLRIGAVITLPDINTSTPAGLVTQPMGHTTPTAITATTGKTYTVQSGDTLHGIAIKLYGKASMWQKIYDTNKAVIGTNPGMLRKGTNLRLPESPTVSTVQ